MPHPDPLRDLRQIEQHLAHFVGFGGSAATFDGVRRCRERPEAECVGLLGQRDGAAAELCSVALELGILQLVDAFRQLDVDLPTPNVYRTASGAPGERYWQQEASHQIKVTLDENNRSLSASETVRYKNNSPDTLRYIWLQLDQNRFADGSMARMTETTPRTPARIASSSKRRASPAS